jgi:hypothetical protein
MAADLEAGDEKPSVAQSDSHDSGPRQLNGATTQPESKANIVDWDGPDDPQNPMNWPSWKRLIQVIFASAFLLTS